MWTSPWVRWGGMLGFALGGFFDGILLHQILQWHHLFSLVPGMADLRLQVLWDGYFHLLMYVVAFVGLEPVIAMKVAPAPPARWRRQPPGHTTRLVERGNCGRL